MRINDPALRLVDERIRKIDFVVVDSIDRRSNDCALREMYAVNRNTTRENMAGRESSNRRSHSQSFTDAGSEVSTRAQPLSRPDFLLVREN
jgi:hypothetical protein